MHQRPVTLVSRFDPGFNKTICHKLLSFVHDLTCIIVSILIGELASCQSHTQCLRLEQTSLLLSVWGWNKPSRVTWVCAIFWKVSPCYNVTMFDNDVWVQHSQTVWPSGAWTQIDIVKPSSDTCDNGTCNDLVGSNMLSCLRLVSPIVAPTRLLLSLWWWTPAMGRFT